MSTDTSRPRRGDSLTCAHCGERIVMVRHLFHWSWTHLPEGATLAEHRPFCAVKTATPRRTP
ncbi:hypothetical protein ACTQ2Q_10085 [Atopobiaceae bacterium LCP21S3_F11]